MDGVVIKYELGPQEAIISIERFAGPSPASIIEGIQCQEIALGVAESYRVPLNENSTFSVIRNGHELISSWRINFAA